jgi:hyperosmotically inducible protein
MKTLPLILSVFVAGIAAFGQPKSTPIRPNLEREVRHELLLIPQYGVFDFLTFSIEGSTVTLNGDARTPVLKNNAEKAVKGIPGVENVVNKINVLPVNTADNAIRIAVYNAVYGNPALQRYAFQALPSIHIIVGMGNVRLEGAVANKADADQALIRAKAVPGTFQVTSNMKTDLQLAAEEERRK